MVLWAIELTFRDFTSIKSPFFTCLDPATCKFGVYVYQPKMLGINVAGSRWYFTSIPKRQPDEEQLLYTILHVKLVSRLAAKESMVTVSGRSVRFFPDFPPYSSSDV